jgi:hypothetical protein
MKTKPEFFLFFALALVVGLGAASVTPTATFFRFQCDPQFAADGKISSAPVQAFWKSSVTVDGQTFQQPVQSVAWDAASTVKTVTIHVASNNGDVTLTDAEILSAVLAAATREKATPALSLRRPR